MPRVTKERHSICYPSSGDSISCDTNLIFWESWYIFFLFSDSELEDLETPPRYRPGSIESLSRATRFTQDEIKRIYRGFKAECPTGVVREDTFKMIYAQFFPQGGKCTQSWETKNSTNLINRLIPVYFFKNIAPLNITFDLRPVSESCILLK